MREPTPYCLKCGRELDKDTQIPLIYSCFCGCSFSILDSEQQLVCSVCSAPNFVGDAVSGFLFHQTLYFCSNPDCPAYTIERDFTHKQGKKTKHSRRLLHNNSPVLLIESSPLCVYHPHSNTKYSQFEINWKENTQLQNFLNEVSIRFHL